MELYEEFEEKRIKNKKWKGIETICQIEIQIHV